MKGIYRLKPEVVAKISAGEVIENPLSAIKELIENSLDAGADRIDVKVISQDFLSFSVRDNGCGMKADEIKVSVERYTTSKIKEEEELLNISTYGFRGEALFSIASVSRLIIRSAVNEGEGYECYFEGGRLKSERPLFHPKGTTVEVYDLFYNSSVRKKFVKGKKHYNYGMMELVFKYKLSNPDVIFSLSDDERNIITLEYGDLPSLFEQIFGYANEVVNVELKKNEEEVRGMLTLPEKSPSYSKIYFIVNKRPISTRMVRMALSRAFGRAIEKGRMPSGIVYLNVPPSWVDVNVHPAKLEVKFKDEHRVVNLITEGIRKGLSSRTRRLLNIKKEMKVQSVNINVKTVVQGEVKEEPLPYESVRSFRVIGTLWNEFLIVEREEALILIDIHAAHEKLIYDRVSQEYVSGGVESVLLLTPLIINAGVEMTRKIIDKKEELERMGFIIDEFGDREVCIRGYPAIIVEEDIKTVLLGATDSIEEGSWHSVIRKIAREACKKAVKAGERLSALEIDALLSEVRDMKRGAYCPHGRPVLYVLPKSDVERWFTRR